jgi:hypothetical protein
MMIPRISLRRIQIIVKSIFDNKFTVRVSALQTPGQLLKEIEAINANDLPAIIIVFDGMKYNPDEVCAEADFSLVFVERFAAFSDDRAGDIMEGINAIVNAFPVHGRKIHGLFFIPIDIQPVAVDPLYVSFAFGLKVKASLFPY